MRRTPDAETDRLKKVYQDYHANPVRQTQWSMENPGNRAIWDERRRVIHQVLRESSFLPLEDKRILEIGCGGGRMLAEFLAWEARPENLYGVDLLADRIESARQQYPEFHFECANAENLNFPDTMFDLVLFFTVLSSILDESMQERVAAEARRVLKKGGAILWYDFRYNNPANPHVRGMTRSDLRRLFPGFTPWSETITLLPPLARRLGGFTSRLYPLLAEVPFLRTHYLVLLRNA